MFSRSRLAVLVALIVATMLVGSALGFSTPALASTGGPFTYAAGHGEKCLDVQNFSTSPGGNIQQWSCKGLSNADKNQNWYHDYSGTYLGYPQMTLRSQHSGLCIDAFRGLGQQLTQQQCNGGLSQLWLVHSIWWFGTYYYKFRSAQYSDSCIDVRRAGTENGDAVILFDCHDGWNQLFS